MHAYAAPATTCHSIVLKLQSAPQGQGSQQNPEQQQQLLQGTWQQPSLPPTVLSSKLCCPSLCKHVALRLSWCAEPEGNVAGPTETSAEGIAEAGHAETNPVDASASAMADHTGGPTGMYSHMLILRLLLCEGPQMYQPGLAAPLCALWT